MRINNNLAAINTHRQYGINNAAIAKSTEKLSSGYRINRAGDDAAGLAISEKMRAQIRGLNMASKNSQDGISLIQTAEGALQESHNILQRMRELSVQAASDTNDDGVDRAALDAEFQQLKEEIDNTAEKTTFNGFGVIDGEFNRSMTVAADVLDAQDGVEDGTTVFELGSAAGLVADGYGATVQISIDADGKAELLQDTPDGAGQTIAVGYIDDKEYAAGDRVNIQFSDGSVLRFEIDSAITTPYKSAGELATAIDLGTAIDFGNAVTGDGMTIQTGANQGDELTITIQEMDAETLGIANASIDTQANASEAITWVNDAVDQVSTQRAQLGALQNRLNHKIANLDSSAENLQAAESRIRDVDMAKEMATFTKNNILSQASTAMLAQANSLPQGVLSLLQ